MRNLYVSLIGALAMCLITVSPAVAGSWALGGKIDLANIETSGTEKLNGNSTTTSKTHEESGVVVPSLFLEYTGDTGWTIGVDYIGVDAEMGSNSKSVTDYTTGDAATVTQKVAADLTNHLVGYIAYEGPNPGGLFLQAGVVGVTIETAESLGTGATYGNETLSGVMGAIGYKALLGDRGFIKYDLNMFNYEDVTFTSSTSNTVDIDVDRVGAGISFGITF